MQRKSFILIKLVLVCAANGCLSAEQHANPIIDVNQAAKLLVNAKQPTATSAVSDVIPLIWENGIKKELIAKKLADYLGRNNQLGSLAQQQLPKLLENISVPLCNTYDLLQNKISLLLLESSLINNQRMGAVKELPEVVAANFSEIQCVLCKENFKEVIKGGSCCVKIDKEKFMHSACFERAHNNSTEMQNSSVADAAGKSKIIDGTRVVLPMIAPSIKLCELYEKTKSLPIQSIMQNDVFAKALGNDLHLLQHMLNLSTNTSWGKVYSLLPSLKGLGPVVTTNFTQAEISTINNAFEEVAKVVFMVYSMTSNPILAGFMAKLDLKIEAVISSLEDLAINFGFEFFIEKVIRQVEKPYRLEDLKKKAECLTFEKRLFFLCAFINATMLLANELSAPKGSVITNTPQAQNNTVFLMLEAKA